MDYILQNIQYRYMENILQQIACGASARQNSLAAPDASFAHIFRQTQAASGAVDAGELEAVFEEASRAYDVPVDLLKAVGKTESGFDPHAQSPVGAQGVMQLMPETARGLGVEDPFDARSNIMGGAKYLSDLLKRYDGDLDLTLAAYNAGSGNVEKYGGVPPFQETRNYISKVKEYMGDAENLLSGSRLGDASDAEWKMKGQACRLCGNQLQTEDRSEEMLELLSELIKAQTQRRMILEEDFTDTFI